MKVISFLLSLFVFLGMFLCEKRNLKNESIFLIFGLLLFCLIVSVIPYGYSFLYHNYHKGTLIYFLMGSIFGYLFMKLCSYKYDKCDNIVLTGFSLFISFLVSVSKFNIFSLIVAMLFYVVLGIYIRNSKSFISVLIGSVLGVLLSFFNTWMFGYIFCLVAGFIIYFVSSLSSMVFRNKNQVCYYFLGVGMILGFLGSIL